MIRPQLRADVRPPFRPRPRVIRSYEASTTGGYQVDVHSDECPCLICARSRSDDLAAVQIDPPLPVVRLTLGAIVAGNVIAFMIDPVGAWHAVGAAVAHLLGIA